MSNSKAIQNVAIIGGGLMGQGIAQVSAKSGFATTLIKASGNGAAPTRARIETSLNRAVEKGKLGAEDAAGALSRLTVTGDRDALASADIVIESIIEDLETKKQLFAGLVDVVPAHCIFASNTSTLRIRDLAPASAVDRTIGLHFFSPVPAMRLVELAYLEATPDSVQDSATAFVEGLGKTPIPVLDSSGFIVNRLLVPYLLGAVAAYAQGLAPAPNIDTAMKLGCAHPVGPLMLCDLIGLDIVYSMSKLLYRDFGDARFEPPALLGRLVEEGHLGKKSGAGFYDHSQRPAVPNATVWQFISAGNNGEEGQQQASTAT
ncbi:MAG: 3-hydroxybutyryl-CoA dehydrogenase [Myxococcales bacterium]|nr:3-hydroxybutyryl-CoA dehydrogenase [Myxococcales bacterium]